MAEQTLPVAASVDEVVRLFGLSRTDIYDLLKAGTIKAKKRGRTTLVLVDGLRRHLDSLPDAEFGAGGGGAGAKLRRPRRAA